MSSKSPYRRGRLAPRYELNVEDNKVGEMQEHLYKTNILDIVLPWFCLKERDNLQRNFFFKEIRSTTRRFKLCKCPPILGQTNE